MTLGGFNQALLGKQAWRVWFQSESLLSHILKSRYFKNYNILECSMSSRPSYECRSIMFGRDMLVKCLILPIGNGKDILVWHDKWILNGLLRAPLSVSPMVDSSLHVSDLLVASQACGMTLCYINSSSQLM